MPREAPMPRFFRTKVPRRQKRHNTPALTSINPSSGDASDKNIFFSVFLSSYHIFPSSPPCPIVPKPPDTTARRGHVTCPQITSRLALLPPDTPESPGFPLRLSAISWRGPPSDLDFNALSLGSKTTPVFCPASPCPAATSTYVAA